MSVRVLTHVIKKVVVATTSPDASTHPTAAKELAKYLNTAQTADLVYLQIGERAQENAKDELVLSRALKLIKANVNMHPPSQATLLDLDFVLDELLKEPHLSAATRKSIRYTRAMISRARRTVPKTHNSGSTRLLAATKSPLTTVATATSSEIKEAILQGNRLVANLLMKRAETGALETSRSSEAHDESSLLWCPFFRGGPTRRTRSFDNDREFFWSEDVRDRIQTVQEAKKAAELEGMKGMNKRKGLDLFQFKYYKQQEALNLSEDEIDCVVNAVLNPPEGENETRLIASKILIKIILDSFLHEGEKAFQMIVSITSEMIESDGPSALHAFDLLFNLSVHINLWDEASLLDGESESVSNASVLSEIQHIQDNLFGVLREMLFVLYAKECPGEDVWGAALDCLLFWISHDGYILKEKLFSIDPKVFIAFLDNLPNASGGVQRKLVRMLVNILYRRDDLDVGMVRNLGGIGKFLELYMRVRSCEGRDNIFLVIFDYVTSSDDADFASLPYKFGDYESAALLELLKEVNAPPLFVGFVEVVPDNLVQVVLDHVLPAAVGAGDATESEAGDDADDGKESGDDDTSIASSVSTPAHPLSHQSGTTPPSTPPPPSLMSLSSATSGSPPKFHVSRLQVLRSHVTRRALSIFLQRFEVLCRRFQKVEGAALRIESVLLGKAGSTSEEEEKKQVAELNLLLHSEKAEDRVIGKRILQKVLCAMMSPGWTNVALKSLIDSTLNLLLRDDKPEVRAIYVSTIRALLLFSQYEGDDAVPAIVTGGGGGSASSSPSTSSIKAASIAASANQWLGRVVARQDFHEANQLQLFYTVFDLCCVLLPCRSTATVGSALLDDSPHMQFLHQSAVLDTELLAHLKVTIFHHMFTHIHGRNNPTVLEALLLIMIKKCSSSAVALEAVGGVGFFTNLLAHLNPNIAYHSSRFLINMLEKEKPEEFNEVMTRLFYKAQQTNDAKLLSNSFLQIKALLGDKV